MQQQQPGTPKSPKSQRESLTLTEEKSTEDCDSSSEADNTMRKESMLLKAHYFCRIGMGTKSMQAMSSETQRRMTTYFHEKATIEGQEQSLTVTPSTSDTQVADDEELPVLLDSNKASILIDMDENPEEWVRRRLMTRNMLQKANILSRMGMGRESLESMTPFAKARLTRYHQEQSDEIENLGEGPSDQCDLNNSGSSNEGEISFDFVEKTDEEARNCYYDKLIKMKVLKMTPSKKNQSIIIFDWDDTLLCTSYVVALGTKGVAPSVVSVLKPVDTNASKLLSKTADSGQVFIVTNAEEGWVQYSAKVFLPETYKMIVQKEIIVISARTCYQDQFPGDTCRWKKEAFTSLMKYFERDIVTNLMCIGDSQIEMDAAHVLGKQFEKALIKTIKFKENPKPEELAKQQHLVLEKFEQIFLNLRNTTIKLEKKSV